MPKRQRPCFTVSKSQLAERCCFCCPGFVSGTDKVDTMSFYVDIEDFYVYIMRFFVVVVVVCLFVFLQ